MVYIIAAKIAIIYIRWYILGKKVQKKKSLTLHNSCTGVKNWGNDAKKKQIFVIDNEE